MVKCGNHDSRTKHNDADQVKICYAGAGVVSSELIVTSRETYTLSVVAFPEYEDDGAAAAEQAYERHLEDRGYDEARFQDDMEARNGVISFSDAWDLADPSRVAERELEQARDREDEEQAWLAKQRKEEAANSWSRADRERAGFIGGNKQSPRGSDCSGRPPFPTKGGVAVFPEVAPGHYAIEVDGVVKFYKVDHGKEGTRWAKYVFLSVQASDDFHPIKNQGSKCEILQAIAENPQEAMTRYGREIGRCGHCHRTLTDEESRARGIGPICAAKLGW